MVNKGTARLLDRWLPRQCRLCGLPGDSSLPLCSLCRGALTANTAACVSCALPLPPAAGELRCGPCQASPPPWTRVRAPWLYEDNLGFLLKRWKFQGEHQLSTLLATLWLAGNPEPPELDLVVPVPLHWWRQVRRGYNQAELLARAILRAACWPAHPSLDARLVKRRRATSAQSGLDAAARRRNLGGAFTVRRRCDNLRVAVVDDVLTTGATATAVTRALYRAGAREVEIWCLARTPPPA